jgi:LacI family transcriptional regulator
MIDHLGLPSRKEFVLSVDSTPDGSYKYMSRILESRPVLPSALFVATDIMAYGCMKAIKEHGLRIPEDISIIGFDNLAVSSATEPGLTSFGVAKDQMGRLATELLIKRIENPDTSPVRALVGGSLIVRDSVRAIG